ncbi:MAG: hypothetical protein GYB31_16195 [Bacteroidetes bacterium]|nr:hypothetical protein [Bacteroidota bacterium]
MSASILPDTFTEYWMTASILIALAVMTLYFCRAYGTRKANYCYGFGLLVFALAQINILLVHKSIEGLLFLPVWYPLLLGPLFFFYIKFTLYPAYRLRFSDLKHLFLPILQASFYWIVFLADPERKLEIYNQLYLPWFKTIEGGLYILSFFGYLALSYRYLKYKESVLRLHGFSWQRRQIRWMKVHVRVLFLLAGLNTFYILADFVAYNFLKLNLYKLPGFGNLIDLSFSVVVIWVSWKGWEWAKSKRLLKKLSPANSNDLSWDQLATKEKRFLDPELSPKLLALATNSESALVKNQIEKENDMPFLQWLATFRLQEMEKRKTNPLYQKYHPLSLALISGFPSEKSYRKAVEQLSKNAQQ